ncbi:hypothetical protein ACQ4N7_09435 [Nodosilinea sp. AN01ver1]|uniref:hypothetical protein n=1 Tax=Nodosilinea sp. AN01ver1 TaxID=3423362 RepID=UPI003D3184BB
MAQVTRRLRVLLIGAIALVASILLTQGIDWASSSSGGISPLALAQDNAPPPALAPALPMVSGSFEDPQGRFQIGILDGYSVSTVGATPLFQAADGSLAYTVAVAPLLPNSSPEAAMVAAAESTFGAGEGFVAGDVQPIAGGGVRINWAGRLSQGAAPPQPITGKIFARQRDAQVYLLMVAATSTGEAQVADAINALGSTLVVP